MEDLQATVEIAVDLGRLCNVDLFQRGFYKVAVKLLEPVHPQAKVEVHILKTSDTDHFSPAKVLEDGLGARSKCLQVLYKRQESHLNHTFLFRVHCLLDSQKIVQCLKKFNFQLETTLHFSQADDLPEDLTKDMEEVSKRILKLELDLIYGLFANTMVLFDYGYMAGLEVTIHASLVALHQPLMTMPGIVPNTKGASLSEPATLESILFRPPPGMSVGQAVSFDVKMSNAISVHAKLIKVLLTVYAHMQNYYVALLRKVSTKGVDLHGSVDVAKKLREMTLSLQQLKTLEEIVNQVNMNLASTCSLILALWSHVLDTSCQNRQVRKMLASKYHAYRVQRFQNGFFKTENPRNSTFDDNRYGVYNWMASDIRSSRYFAELPTLPIHSEEADGTAESMPIIFEDVFTHHCKKEPVFRPRSAQSVFSRTSPSHVPAASSSAHQNGFLDVMEETGREEAWSRSPNGSISSCGEASEATVTAAREESGTVKRRKYSGFFKKKRGSYKLRTERLSVSDDESTKVTLAEFLSSIDDSSSSSKPSRPSKAKTLAAGSSSSSSTKVKSSQPRHAKLKAAYSANDTQPSKVSKWKKRTFSQHRRSLDEGAQRILQLIRIGKRTCDATGQVSESKTLSRSLSSSALSVTDDALSSASRRQGIDGLEGRLIRPSSADQTSGFFKVPASVNGDMAHPLPGGFSTTESRRAENRFRALLRSETSEEPESGISEKPVAMSARTAMISRMTASVASAATITTTIPKAAPLTATVTSSSSTTASPAHTAEQLYHGMVKSQSYSVGIERLQNGVDNPDRYPYPRPHANFRTAVPCGPHGKLKTSHTTLGGLDRVRYGMGLHPGGGTATTTDLSPFDEPELVQSWGELTTASSQRNGTVTLSQTSSGNVSLASASQPQTDDNTFVPQLDQLMPSAVRVSLGPSDAAPVAVIRGVLLSGETEMEDLNGLCDDAAQSAEPGAAFFGNLNDTGEDEDFQELSLTKMLLRPPRSQSLHVFTGSLECSEEPPDDDLIRDLDALRIEKEQNMRDSIFQPTSKTDRDATQSEISYNVPLDGTNASSDSVIATTKYHPKMASRTKLPKLIGEISSEDAEIALLTSVDIFNAIPPLRKQKEAIHVVEKSKLLGRLQFPGFLYADIPPHVSPSPYLSQKLSILTGCSMSFDSHLVVCVHGLDGNSNDLRLVRTYLQLALPTNTNISFLMSRANQDDTYADIDTMTDRLVREILDHIDANYTSGRQPAKISFIGHSLGCLLIRSTVAHERMCHLRSRFHTFLSFSGPHLGIVFNNSTLVNTGLWLIQKWKKSACLLQLSCKDHADLRKTYVYKLSKKKGLEYFSNILLVASAADRYVPYHSARIEMCKQAFRDKTLGPPYQEMLNNVMRPVLNRSKLNLVRYHVVHALPATTANTMIGRAAHIAVLDSELFLEKFLLVAGLQYFV